MTLTPKQRGLVKRLAEMINFGLENLDGEDETNESSKIYKYGCIESLGHMAACCISQWFTHDSQGTGETIEILNLDKLPSKEEIAKSLFKFLEEV